MVRILLSFCLFLSLGEIIRMPSATAQSMEALTDEMAPKVVSLRGLPFLYTVETSYQSLEDLRQVLQQEIARTYPGNTLSVLEKRLLKFGFVASPINLQEMMNRFLSQQIAGYYDPHQKRMVLIDAAQGGVSQDTLFPLEYLSRALIEGSGFSLEKILLSHELTHVLQDQHFDLLSLPIEALDPEDATSAVRALIEGDATLTMFDYLLEHQGGDATRFPELSNTLHAWTESSFTRGFGPFRMIPRYLIDNLFFSYTYGFDFVLQLKQQGGWERVNQAYRDIPVSTEQIMHPEKYLVQRDAPTIIQLPSFLELVSGWQEIEQNTLGELNISILLDGYLPSTQARRASAGWDGDRFALYEHPETGHLVLAWYTTWDTEQEAQEFFQACTAMVTKRDNLLPPPNKGLPDQTSHVWNLESGALYIERRGQDVLMLDGFSEVMLEEVIMLFRTSTLSEENRR